MRRKSNYDWSRYQDSNHTDCLEFCVSSDINQKLISAVNSPNVNICIWKSRFDLRFSQSIDADKLNLLNAVEILEGIHVNGTMINGYRFNSMKQV